MSDNKIAIVMHGYTMRPAYAEIKSDRVKIFHKDGRQLCDISLELYNILVDKTYIMILRQDTSYKNGVVYHCFEYYDLIAKMTGLVR